MAADGDDHGNVGVRMGRGRQARLLIYSHDTFGLGHLRRCRTIAHALVDRRADLTVLILSGSPIIGSFSFGNRVDFIRIPGVIKLSGGEYTPLSLDIGLDDILHLRSSIIRRTAEVFEPDIFLVDKEPLGLRGEVRDTLDLLKRRGVRLVLGLRDVLDEPGALAEEWERKNAAPALQDLYDHILVYGLEQMSNPLADLDLPASVLAKVQYTGYLRRCVSAPPPTLSVPEALCRSPYLLVTTGGGGDGEAMIDWVLRAYETHDLPCPAIVVLGPFMRSALQAVFLARIARLDRVFGLTFDANLEALISGAAGIVAMGGYNTFCEILSFDKPALIVPRTAPRLEQYLRTARAEALGLCTMLIDSGDRDAGAMAAALMALPCQPCPSKVEIPGLLDGTDSIGRLFDRWIDHPDVDRPPVSLPVRDLMRTAS